MLAQHGHLEAGAASPSEGSELVFANGNHFAPESGFIQPLVWTADGPYAGYFHGNITMTVRAATAQRGGPEPNHPALGAELSIELLSVEGPPDGVFSFWESGAPAPSFSVPSGHSSEHRWLLSENEGLEGTDPYGHIHSRRFTASSSGIYTVTFRLHDESSNGADGGSIHESSETIDIRFIAGDGIPVTVRNEGDFVLGLEVHDGAVHAVAREDDGHADHLHDPLNLAKTIFEVDSEYRLHARLGQPEIGSPGNVAWHLPARSFHADPLPEGEPFHESMNQHDSLENENSSHGQGAHDGNEAAHADEGGGEHSHDHASTIEWDGPETPSLSVEAIEDTAGSFNVYLSLSGFVFSPENASRHHVPGEGHAHIYLDGTKLGRIYTESYFLSGLSAGTHTIQVTLNANSHQDYTVEEKLLEASVDVVASEKGNDSTGHGHQHGAETREWDGEDMPRLSLDVQPDPAAGWNLLFDYSHFQLNPRNASQHHVVGEGHTHIYINGEKQTRLYGRAHHLASLPPGQVEVAVRLSSNDHLEYSVDGAFLEISTVVQNGAVVDDPKPLAPLSVSLSAQDIHSEMLSDGHVNVSLLRVEGPGSLVIKSGGLLQGDGHDGEGRGKVVADSRDGLNQNDIFPLGGGELLPLSWLFFQPGDYQVSLSLNTGLADGGGELNETFDLSFRVQPSDELHYVMIDGGLHLTWDTSRNLESSVAVKGHYSVMEGASHHHLVDPSEAMRFYRLAPLVESGHHHE